MHEYALCLLKAYIYREVCEFGEGLVVEVLAGKDPRYTQNLLVGRRRNTVYSAANNLLLVQLFSFSVLLSLKLVLIEGYVPIVIEHCNFCSQSRTSGAIVCVLLPTSYYSRVTAIQTTLSNYLFLLKTEPKEKKINS